MNCILSIVLHMLKEVQTQLVTLFLNNTILENVVVHVSANNGLHGIIARESD